MCLASVLVSVVHLLMCRARVLPETPTQRARLHMGRSRPQGGLSADLFGRRAVHFGSGGPFGPLSFAGSCFLSNHRNRGHQLQGFDVIVRLFSKICHTSALAHFVVDGETTALVVRVRDLDLGGVLPTADRSNRHCRVAASRRVLVVKHCRLAGKLFERWAEYLIRECDVVLALLASALPFGTYPNSFSQKSGYACTNFWKSGSVLAMQFALPLMPVL